MSDIKAKLTRPGGVPTLKVESEHGSCTVAFANLDLSGSMLLTIRDVKGSVEVEQYP